MVIFFLIVGFGFIFFQINNDSSSSIWTQIYNVYMFLYANWEISDYDGFKIPFFIIVSFALFVVLINLLITILGETYSRVQNLAVSSDNIESLDIVIELLYVKKVLSHIFRCLKWMVTKKGAVPKKLSNRQYLFWVSETTGEDDDEQNKWTGKTKMVSLDLQKHIKRVKKETKLSHKQFREKLHIINDLKKKVGKSKAKQEVVHKMVQEVFQELNLYKTENDLTMARTMKTKIEVDK